MFLELLKRRNPDLIRAGVELHQSNKIPSNCYILDLDTIRENAKTIKAEADKMDMKVYAMTKQISREKSLIKTLIEVGITHFVTVDIQCARAVVEAGGCLGHVGHLVQIPKGDVSWVVEQKPEYWTVFSYSQAEQISKNLKKGESQKVLLRIIDDGDTFYRGHEGGFPASQVVDVARKISKIDGIDFAGITSFPCLLFDNDKKDVYNTNNIKTLKRAYRELQAAGWEDVEINTPGTTSTKVLKLFKEYGSTQVEPGHGLTGTTPLHGVKELPEVPGILYVSEISHFYKKQAYCFGGGLYIDPVFPSYSVKCLTGNDSEKILDRDSDIELPADNAIDYYGMLHPKASLDIRSGDSVIMGFRPQTFVTRSYVASVSGIKSGKPVVESISYANGKEVLWP